VKKIQRAEMGTELRDGHLVGAEWIGRTSLRMNYAAWSEGLIASSFAARVWMLSSDASKRPIPQDLPACMQTLDGATERRRPPP
jgi:hypothetical protein